MRSKLLTWIGFCLIFVGVGCAMNEPAATPSPTAVSQVIVLTETAVPPTATTEPTPAVTETAVPTPTLEPTPSPTLPPPPTGQIIFLWDSESLPEFYGSNPHQVLYLAQPGAYPEDWNITTLLSDLVGFPLAVLSPDQTKLALTVLEDRNDDGVISYGSYQRGGDAHNLYIYTLSDHSLKRITENYPDAFNMSWSPDSQEIVFPNDDTVMSYDLNMGVLQILPEENSQKVAKVVWSPAGDQIAYKLFSGALYFLNKETNEVIQVSEIEAHHASVYIAWSLNGTWLAANTTDGGGLVVVNSTLDRFIELVSTSFFCNYTWSPTNNNLAFVPWLREGGASLSVANADGFASKTLFEADTISSPLWTPDGSMITVGFLNEGESGLGVFDPETGEFQQLWQNSHEVEADPVAWSPNGAWLLFSQTQSEDSGLYLIHRNGGEAYLFLDTTGTFAPYSIAWLPENTVSP